MQLACVIKIMSRVAHLVSIVHSLRHVLSGSIVEQHCKLFDFAFVFGRLVDRFFESCLFNNVRLFVDADKCRLETSATMPTTMPSGTMVLQVSDDSLAEFQRQCVFTVAFFEVVIANSSDQASHGTHIHTSRIRAQKASTVWQIQGSPHHSQKSNGGLHTST